MVDDTEFVDLAAPEANGKQHDPEDFIQHCEKAEERYMAKDVNERQAYSSTYSSFVAVGFQQTYADHVGCALASLSLLEKLSDAELLAHGPEIVSDSGGMNACLSALHLACTMTETGVAAKAFSVRAQNL